MKSIRFEPVRWMAWLLALLVALTAAQEKFHLLPATVAHWLLFVSAVLTLLLGERVRALVTALAAPRDSAGRPLVALDNRSPGASGYWPLENDSPELSGRR